LPPTSSRVNSVDIFNLPSAIARDPRRKTAWLKGRLQHERDQGRDHDHNSETVNSLGAAGKRVISIAVGPERKQIAFVKEEALEFSCDDRAGTPYSSELHVGDDVFAPISVEELGLSGEAEALAKIW
jgi:hypothetical protein